MKGMGDLIKLAKQRIGNLLDNEAENIEIAYVKAGVDAAGETTEAGGALTVNISVKVEPGLGPSCLRLTTGIAFVKERVRESISDEVDPEQPRLELPDHIEEPGKKEKKEKSKK